MSQGIAGGIGTLLAMVAFLAVVAWAYGRRRGTDFEAASRLPLEDDPPADAGAGERR